MNLALLTCAFVCTTNTTTTIIIIIIIIIININQNARYEQNIHSSR